MILLIKVKVNLFGEKLSTDMCAWVCQDTQCIMLSLLQYCSEINATKRESIFLVQDNYLSNKDTTSRFDKY